MDSCVEPQNASAFAMTVADALAGAGKLAGIMTGVVRIRTGRDSPFIVHFGFPLHIGGRVELGDLVTRFGIRTESADRAIHDVTGDALDAITEIHVLLVVDRTVIDLPAFDVLIINALNDV